MLAAINAGLYLFMIFDGMLMKTFYYHRARVKFIDDTASHHWFPI